MEFLVACLPNPDRNIPKPPEDPAPTLEVRKCCHLVEGAPTAAEFLVGLDEPQCLFRPAWGKKGEAARAAAKEPRVADPWRLLVETHLQNAREGHPLEELPTNSLSRRRPPEAQSLCDFTVDEYRHLTATKTGKAFFYCASSAKCTGLLAVSHGQDLDDGGRRLHTPMERRGDHDVDPGILCKHQSIPIPRHMLSCHGSESKIPKVA